MIKAQSAILAFFMLTISPFHAAHAETPAADVVTPVEQPQFDVRSNIEDQINAYLASSGLGARQRKGEIAIVKGFGQVQVKPESPDWVKYRMLAFDEALLNAKGDWIQQQNKSIVGDIVKRSFRAANKEPPAYQQSQLLEPGKLAELLEKVQAVGIGKLDEQLKEMGLDPTKYEHQPPAQKYVQMSKDLLKTSTSRSIGDLVGLVTVQTFEGHDAQGNYMIAAVAVVSPKMKEFAQEVLRLRGNFPSDPSRAQNLDRLISDKAALVNDFGIRWLYDENGLPVIVSFYQWGLDTTGTDQVMANDDREFAIAQATEQADLQIAQFLSSTAMSTTKGAIGKQSEKAVERAIDGYIADTGRTTTLMDGIDRVYEERAKVDNLTGLQTLTTWGYKHPVSNKMVVGVIRIWSAAGELATRAIKDTVVRPAIAPEAATTAGTAGTTKGRDLNKASDF